MKIDCIIGIDPGASGSIVTWRPNANTKAIKMPRNIEDFRAYMDWAKTNFNPIVFMEKVTVRPDDVKVDGTAANMGKLYRVQKMIADFEQMKALLTVLNIPFVLVNPMKWQSELKLRVAVKGKPKEEKSDRKKRYRDIAGKLYPEIAPTLWNADATLIMHFGRYMLQNKRDWVLENLPTKMHNTLF